MARALRVAVIGPGRAGRARIRALRDHPRAELGAEVARSGEPTLARVGADRSIDAALVCTPNLLHVAQVRTLLEGGKHVAVEFPLAPTVDEARVLFALAEREERVLHVAHIELLSPSQARQRERAADLGRPTGGTLTFTGGNAGWIGDPQRAGSPALRALARLHRLLDLFGPARIAGASLVEREGGYRLELGLAFGDGGRPASSSSAVRAWSAAPTGRCAASAECWTIQAPPRRPACSRETSTTSWIASSASPRPTSRTNAYCTPSTWWSRQNGYARADYLPLNVAGLFSRKDCTPSRWSSVVNR